MFFNEETDLVRKNQDNDLNDKKLTKLDSITVNRNPSLDNEIANEKFVDDSVEESNILRFIQTLEKYVKVSVGNDTYNFTKFDKIQTTHTTIIKAPNSGGYLLQNWNINCNDKNGNAKISNFIESTKTNSPTGDSGATSLPPIGDSFMYIETSSNNNADNVLCSFERTNNIQFSNITFFYNRFSAASNNSMGRFIFQLLLDDNTWSIRYNIPKNDRYSDSSTDWTLVILNFSAENYGVRLIYNEIDSAHADMCFSNITKTNSVF